MAAERDVASRCTSSSCNWKLRDCTRMFRDRRAADDVNKVCCSEECSSERVGDCVEARGGDLESGSLSHTISMRQDSHRKLSFERFQRLSKFGLMLVRWRRHVMFFWLFGGFGGVALIFSILYVYAVNNRQNDLVGTCSEVGDLLKTQFSTSLNQTLVFSALVATFLGSKSPVDYQRFSEFSAQTRSLRPFVSQVVYMERVFDAGRADFEGRLNGTIKDIHGQPAARSDQYLPCTYLETPNEDLNLLDMLAVPGQGEAIQRAMSSGQAEVFHPELVNKWTNVTDSIAMLAFWPVYNDPPPPNTSPEQRRAAWTGFMGVAFKLEEMADSIRVIRAQNDSVMVHIYYTKDNSEWSKIPLYRSEGRGIATSTEKQWATVVKVGLGCGATSHEVRCRYMRPFVPWQPITWALAGVVIVVLSGIIFHATSKRLEAVEGEYHRMEALNDQTEVARTHAEEASKAKGAFLATVSHEMRTPLNGMIGMMNLLSKTKLDAVQQDYVETASLSGRALCELINDVLDLSKIEAGRMDLENIPFDIRDEVDCVLSLFGEKAREKGIEVAAFVQDNLPPLTIGDPLRFRQVLINLVGNAFKFTEEGHVFVSVRLARPDEPAHISKIACPLNVASTCALSTPSSHSSSSDGLVRPSSLNRLLSPPIRCLSTALTRKLSHPQSSAGQEGSHHNKSPIRTPPLPPRWDRGLISLSSKVGVEHSNDWSRTFAAITNGLADKMPVTGEAVRLVISVEDTGSGIPAEAQKQLFKPFVQADASTTRMHGGTGIGLCISKRLVNLMGGDITFVSNPGQGTTFSFDVKLNMDGPGVMDRTTSGRSMPPPAQNLQHLQGLHVLCFDDRHMRSQVLASYLRRLGMVPHITTSLDGARRELERSIAKPVPFATIQSGTDSSNTSSLLSQSLDSESGTSRHRDAIPGSGAVPLPTFSAFILDSEALRRHGSLAEVRERFGEGSGLEGLPPLVLASQSMTPSAEKEAREAGISGVLLKPIRKSALAACMLQVLLEEGKGKRGLVARTPSESRNLSVNYTMLLSIALRGRRIAVVDDNPVNRKVIGKMLGRYNVEVLLLSSGVQAVKDLRPPHNVDCILMDIQMPEMDGYETTRLLRKMETDQSECARVPIIALTADVLKESKVRCMDSGMDSFMSKPVDEEQLYRVFSKYFGPGTESEPTSR